MKVFICKSISFLSTLFNVAYRLYRICGLHKLASLTSKSFSMSLWKARQRNLGHNTLIYPHVALHCPENISIGSNVAIAEFTHMWGNGKISIGNDVMIASHTVITSQTHEVNPQIRRSNITDEVVIEDNVWIGAHAIILPGIRIEKDSAIAAGGVVTKNVAAGSVVAGVPAKLIYSSYAK